MLTFIPQDETDNTGQLRWTGENSNARPGGVTAMRCHRHCEIYKNKKESMENHVSEAEEARLIKIYRQ